MLVKIAQDRKPKLMVTDEMVERAWKAGVADLSSLHSPANGGWDKSALRTALLAALDGERDQIKPEVHDGLA